MSKTISRNYRDRTSPYKWLVRDTDKPIETAIAPGHCSRLRLETKGNRGLAPTTARAGFGAHL